MVAGALRIKGTGDTFLIMTTRLAGVLGLGTFVAGCLHIHLRSATPRLDTSILPYTDHREVQVTAHVIAEGQIQCSGFGELGQSLDVESEQILDADGQRPCSHRHSAQWLLSLGGTRMFRMNLTFSSFTPAFQFWRLDLPCDEAEARAISW